MRIFLEKYIQYIDKERSLLTASSINEQRKLAQLAIYAILFSRLFQCLENQKLDITFSDVLKDSSSIYLQRLSS